MILIRSSRFYLCFLVSSCRGLCLRLFCRLTSGALTDCKAEAIGEEFLKRVHITDALVVRVPEEASRFDIKHSFVFSTDSHWHESLERFFSFLQLLFQNMFNLPQWAFNTLTLSPCLSMPLGIICPKYPDFIHYEVRLSRINAHRGGKQVWLVSWNWAEFVKVSWSICTHYSSNDSHIWCHHMQICIFDLGGPGMPSLVYRYAGDEGFAGYAVRCCVWERPANRPQQIGQRIFRLEQSE